MLKRDLLILFLSPIFFLLTNKIYADSFYSSGADTSDCSVSMAVALSYQRLPTNIYYNSGLINGLKTSGINGLSFENIATDAYPNAQRYYGNGTNLSVPPGTEISITSFLKNSNPYIVNIPGGDLFTSLENSSEGNISNFFQNMTNNVTDIYNFEGKSYTRSGLAISLPNLGSISAYSELKNNILNFTTIQPIVASRTVTHTFNSKGDLLMNFSLLIENVSAYEENNISINDSYPGVYYENTSIDLPPHSSKTIDYTANFGIDYRSSINIPGAIITDPNSHTEIFSRGESSYVQNPDAVSVVFKRSDEGAPSSWVGNQTTLPILNTNSNMSITLIPYAFTTNPYIDNITPNLVITKTQNGVMSEISETIGDKIHYEIKIVNNGNAPAVNIDLLDGIPPFENIVNIENSGVNCTINDNNNLGIPCHNEIDWQIPYIGIGQEVDLSFDGVVANNAFDGSTINNQVYGIYNNSHTVYSNVVVADIFVTPISQIFTTENLVLGSMVTSTSGVIIGYVWNDLNKNAILDTNEPVIQNADVSIEYLDPNTDKVIQEKTKSDQKGIYEFTNLPLNTSIKVTFSIPQGFEYSSTFTNYEVILNGKDSMQEKDGIAYLVSDKWYENRANLGLFNATLPDTGQPVSDIYYVVGIFLSVLLSIYVMCRLTKRLFK